MESEGVAQFDTGSNSIEGRLFDLAIAAAENCEPCRVREDAMLLDEVAAKDQPRHVGHEQKPVKDAQERQCRLCLCP